MLLVDWPGYIPESLFTKEDDSETTDPGAPHCHASQRPRK